MTRGEHVAELRSSSAFPVALSYNIAVAQVVGNMDMDCDSLCHDLLHGLLSRPPARHPLRAADSGMSALLSLLYTPSVSTDASPFGLHAPPPLSRAARPTPLHVRTKSPSTWKLRCPCSTA